MGCCVRPHGRSEHNVWRPGGMILSEKTRRIRRKPYPLVPHCAPQILYRLTRTRIRASAVRARLRTAWPMARPSSYRHPQAAATKTSVFVWMKYGLLRAILWAKNGNILMIGVVWMCQNGSEEWKNLSSESVFLKGRKLVFRPQRKSLYPNYHGGMNACELCTNWILHFQFPESSTTDGSTDDRGQL
jgi:hypothetical protein